MISKFKLKASFFYFIGFMVIPLSVICQQYKIKESKEEWPNLVHTKIYDVTTDQLILFNYQNPLNDWRIDQNNLIIEAWVYDKELNYKYHKTVDALQGKTYLGNFATKYGVTLFYTVEKVVYSCQFSSEDGTTKNEQKLFNLSGPEESLKFGLSGDSNFYYIVNNSLPRKFKNNNCSGVIFDARMKPVTKFSYIQYEESADIKKVDYFLSNQGSLVALRTLENGNLHSKTISPLLYSIDRVLPDGKTKHYDFTGLPEGLISNMDCVADKDNLNFFALKAESKKTKFSECLIGCFNFGEQKLTAIEEVNLESFLPDGIPQTAGLVNVLQNKDLSTIIIFEDEDVTWGFSKSKNSIVNEYIMRGPTEPLYSKNNLYIFKLSAAKKIEWINIIPKQQAQQLTKELISYAFIKDKEDNLHLVFNDRSNNNSLDQNYKTPNIYFIPATGKGSSILSAVRITSDGKMTKITIRQNKDVKNQMAPIGFVTTANNEILYTSYKLKRRSYSGFRLSLLGVMN